MMCCAVLCCAAQIMMADRSATQLGPVLRRMWADGGPRGLFRGNMATVGKRAAQGLE